MIESKEIFEPIFNTIKYFNYFNPAAVWKRTVISKYVDIRIDRELVSDYFREVEKGYFYYRVLKPNKNGNLILFTLTKKGKVMMENYLKLTLL